MRHERAQDHDGLLEGFRVSETIKPALTPEQWRFTVEHPERWVLQEPRHAAAALSLYGQPFGFTREDVDELRFAVHLMHGEWSVGDIAENSQLQRLLNIADRIEALLPPEEMKST